MELLENEEVKIFVPFVNEPSVLYYVLRTFVGLFLLPKDNWACDILELDGQ